MSDYDLMRCALSEMVALSFFIVALCFYIPVYFSIMGYSNLVAFLNTRDLCLDVCGVLNINPLSLTWVLSVTVRDEKFVCVCVRVYACSLATPP